MYGSASPTSVARKTRTGSPIRRRASRNTQSASPSQKTSASETAAFRATTNAVEWKKSWREVKEDESGRSSTAKKCPPRGHANALTQLDRFLGPPFQAQCPRSAG